MNEKKYCDGKWSPEALAKALQSCKDVERFCSWFDRMCEAKGEYDKCVFHNDRDGLDTLLRDVVEQCGVCEVLRAARYGDYKWEDPYVWVASDGNLYSTAEIDPMWVSELVAWLFEAGHEFERRDVISALEIQPE